MSRPLPILSTPAAAPPEAAPLTRYSPIPWGLVIVLSLLFVVVWLLPPLGGLKQSDTIFPLTLHTVMESFSFVVSVLVFAVSWHAYSRERAGNLMILACGFLAVALLDFGHTLSYRGMPDFVTPSSPQKAIIFWLAARYVAALTLLTIALRPWQPLARPRDRYRLMLWALLVTAAVFVSELYLPDFWPTMFVPGVGLTGLKIAAEYGLIAILGATAVILYPKTQGKPAFDAANLFTAVLITILSELCFTLYSNVNDVFQLLGHTYKVIAYFWIYKAVFVSSVRDPYLRLSLEMAERQAAEARIQFLAYHDPLTELPNRILVRERFERAAERAGVQSSRVGLVYIDLDNFKTVNDSLGHTLGDLLLQGIGQRLQSLVPAGSTVSRQGGDEFLILLEDLERPREVESLVNRIVEQMQQPFAIQDHDLSTSVSIGISLFPDDGGDFDTLLKKADTAMYRAKGAGRNGYRFFDREMDKDVGERLRLSNDLRLALARNEFVLHYQPQIDLRTQEVIGAEALIRWQHPELGLLAPGRFIGIAEDTGLIVPIGEWVIRMACHQAAAWQRAGLPPLVVAVNLSAVQFMRGDLVGTVASALATSALPSRCLELELTESILIQDAENILGTVQRLNAIGVQMSIDDFGTGYSSLSYLKRFAVDKLKVDQSFVRDLCSDPDDAAIVRAIIQLARSLGLKTIAEGVETAEILALLQELGCDEAQGYYFAKPLPADNFSAFLSQRLS